MKATIIDEKSGVEIHRNIYGHFAEHLGRGIYEGIWVGTDSEIPHVRGIRKDVIAALRAIEIPVLRWPGGCFADEYHWRDGIGPYESRKRMYNSHWGGVVETNHFGTHEFFDLCDQLSCDAYVCGNVGSGTVQEMSEWVEYMTSAAESPLADLRRTNGREEPWNLPYFGVGNESWGCGGNMRPEFYADEYRRYNTYVRTYGQNKIARIACGPNSWDLNWTEILMDRAKGHMDGLSLHNYTLLHQSWPPSGSAIEFGVSEWNSILKAALRMDELIDAHGKVMDRHDPEAKVGLIVDEWGTWHAPEKGSTPGFLYQQNSLRDAIVAGLHFHIFHRHAKRVTMANIAQTVNVLQAMILTDGPQMILTPTYWVFEMFRHHQGGQLIAVDYVSPEYAPGLPKVSVSASKRADQGVFVSLVCLDPSGGITVDLSGLATTRVVSAQILTSQEMQAHNSFESPHFVHPVAFTGFQETEEWIVIDMPAMSIVTLQFA